jgi:hypothetical protein
MELKNASECHPEESRSDRDDEGSLWLLDFTTAGILLPRLRDQNDMTETFFSIQQEVRDILPATRS